MVVAVSLDRSGWARRQVERELHQRLGELGAEVSFDALEFDWLGPGLQVEGFRITEGERVLLRANRLYVAVGYAPADGAYLSRLDLDGGGLLICDPLIDDLRALFELKDEQGAEPNERLRVPTVGVRDFDIDFEDAGGRKLALGRVDFSMEGETDRPAALNGRLSLNRREEATLDPELFLSGLLSPDGLLELHTTASDLDLASWEVPALLPLEMLRSLHPLGKVTLHTSGSLNLRGETRARGSVRCALRGGSLVLPVGETALVGLAADLEATYLAGPDSTFWDPSSWSGTGVLGASWAGQELRGGVRLGHATRPGALIEGWVHAPSFRADIPEVQALSEPWLLRNILDALDPRGAVDAAVAFQCLDGWSPGEALEPALEFSVRVASSTPLEAAWHGWKLPDRPGWVPISFPLPTHGGEGKVIVAHNARFSRRELVDVDVSVEHPTGTANVRYQEWTHPLELPPTAPGYGERESDLLIEIPGIDLDERVRENIWGLSQIEPLRHLYEDGFGLRGGRAAVSVRVAERSPLTGSAVRVVAGLSGVEAAWVEMPVLARRLSGEVEVIDDGRGETSVRFDLGGVAQGCGDLTVAGRIRTTPAEQEDPRGPSRLELDVTRVAVEKIELEGPAPRIAGEVVPEIADVLKEVNGRGEVNLELVRSVASGGDDEWIWAEVTPEQGAALEPVTFPMHSTQVRGRVLVGVERRRAGGADGEVPGRIESAVARLAPLTGLWRGELPVAVQASFASPGESAGRVVGAGLRLGDEELIRELARALAIDPEAVQQVSNELVIEGALDFESEFTLPEDPRTAARELYRLHLRRNDLRHVDGFRLDGLTGALELAGRELRVSELTARLDDTPVRLRDVVASMEDGALRLDADLEVAGLALDRDLLARFLDEESVGALVDRLHWRGQLDVDHGHLALARCPGQPLEVVLSGEGTLSDAHVELGVPLSIGSARVELEKLVFGDEEVRGYGKVHDLYGRVLDREIGQAEALVSYYGSRITMESLSGSFCKGGVRGLLRSGAASPSWSGPVFSVDLAPPFEFEANVALEEVDVALLLEDVFASSLADRGILSGEMSLQGKLQDLLSIRGSGRGDVRDTVLWSVPVLRDLFSQLGFDATAVFDSMHTDFRVGDGRIYMEGIEVHSPLLRLRGRGILGLDGTLAHDLEVKYSLVDKIGLLGSLVYALQNTLLSVSIRGDMSRPKVFLGGALTSPFSGVDEEWRALPLPALSPLPERF